MPPLPQIPIYEKSINMTLFKNKVFADVMKTRLFWIRIGPNAKIDVLIKRGNLDRDT